MYVKAQKKVHTKATMSLPLECALMGREGKVVYMCVCIYICKCFQFSHSAVSLSDPWTAAHEASLSVTNSQSLFKLMSTDSVMPSNHLILCRPLLLPPSIFPSIRIFSMSQFFESGCQSTGVSAST